MPRPYFESVRDVYLTAARELYKLAAQADPETADPESFLARGEALERQAHETWPATTRQERQLYRLRCLAEANTKEGRRKAADLRKALGVASDEDEALLREQG
jgi:hypothetical protein